MGAQQKAVHRILSVLLFLSMILSSAVLVPAAPVLAQAPKPGQQPVSGDGPDTASLLAEAGQRGSVPVIVVLKTAPPADNRASAQAMISAAQDRVMSTLANHPVDKIYRYENLPMMAMRVDKVGLQALVKSPDVLGVEKNVPHKLELAESTKVIGADKAWNLGLDGSGTYVAVIDTGVEKTHPFLAGKVDYEACYSGGDEYSDDDGYTVSTCPMDASEIVAPGAGVQCSAEGCEHGTHVAGIIAGSGPNFSGVAPGANIIAINVFSRYIYWDGTGEDLITMTSDYLKALDRVYFWRKVYNLNIVSVNMSLGGGAYKSACDARVPATKAAIDRLRAANVATVIASGNGGWINAVSSPGCVSTAISVGATTKADQVAYFSNSAKFLQLLAPGYQITSSVPVGTGIDGGDYDSFNGTSMAAPHVAGAWAVMRQFQPKMSVTNMLALLKSNAVQVTDYRNGLVKPRINLSYALGKYIRPTGTITLTGPVNGAQLTESTPIYQWNEIGMAKSYTLTVKKGGTILFAKTLAAGSVCDPVTGECSYHAPNILPVGTFNWTIKGTAASGASITSAPFTLSTPFDPPNPVTLQYPVTDLDYYPLQMTWAEDLTAPSPSSYAIELRKNGALLWTKTTTADAICSEGTCNYKLPVLQPGNYTYKVTASSPAGKAPPVPGAFSVTYPAQLTTTFAADRTGWTNYYPGPSDWFLAGDPPTYYTWYGNNYTWASTGYNALYKNIDFTVRIAREGSSNYSSGIIVRGVPTLRSDKDWKTGYQFLYTNDGYYSVWKRVNGALYRMLDWTSIDVPGSYINSNDYNTLRVVASGSYLEFYINGTRVAHGTDSSITAAGVAGVISYVGYWSDDYLTLDTASITNLSALATPAPASGLKMRSQLMTATSSGGSPFGPKVSMAEYTRILKNLTALQGSNPADKLQVCQQNNHSFCPATQK